VVDDDEARLVAFAGVHEQREHADGVHVQVHFDRGDDDVQLGRDAAAAGMNLVVRDEGFGVSTAGRRHDPWRLLAAHTSAGITSGVPVFNTRGFGMSVLFASAMTRQSVESPYSRAAMAFSVSPSFTILILVGSPGGLPRACSV